MSLDQLRAHLAEALKRVERMGALHGVIMPMLFAMSQFEELYRELFEGANTLDALRLTQGFDNMTMEGDRALWRLSRARPVHARGARHSIQTRRGRGNPCPGKIRREPAVPG